MSIPLDRDGIFRVRPVSWRVQQAKESKAIGVAIECIVREQLHERQDENGQKFYEWEDWSTYLEHRVWGTWWVVNKHGQPNETACEQLAVALGWNGDLRLGAVPQVDVQVTVKPDTYNGKTTFKASWMNPGDYTPQPGGMSSDEVDALNAQFGSLLRAATAGAKKAGPKPPAKDASKPSAAPAASKPPAVAAKEERRGDAQPDDDIPF